MRTLPVLCALAVAGCGDNNTLPAPDPSPEMPDHNVTRVERPTLDVVEVTSTGVVFEVCAGRTGLPAGFELQWMPADNFAGWPGMFDGNVCSATMFGELGSRFAVPAFDCVTFGIGRLFDEDPAISYTCDELACERSYVFHAHGLATEDLDPSAMTPDVQVTTLECYEPPPPPSDGCTHTQGYWKNHEDAWPVTALMLGAISYATAEALAILHEPAAGNGILSLAHQLIAAKLNIASGANAADVTAVVEAADALIGSAMVPPIGTGYLRPGVTSPLVDQLAAFNEGATGPGHCCN